MREYLLALYLEYGEREFVYAGNPEGWGLVAGGYIAYTVNSASDVFVAPLRIEGAYMKWPDRYAKITPKGLEYIKNA